MPETVAEIGEFGMIRRINELVVREGAEAPGVTLGIGDDTASFLPRRGFELLVTCDSVVEGRHYLPGRITYTDLGRRAMALNISDIGAMGGRPLYSLISLGLRGDLRVSDVEALYKGFLQELNPFRASIIGGNITQAGNGIFIDITLIGEVEEGRKVCRSTAGAGDAILVTGYPGQSAAGLRLLLAEGPAGGIPDHPLVRAFNTPGHRAREGRAVALTGAASAMIDTSDGFLGDLGHICEESRVGAELILERLPLSEALIEAAGRLGHDPCDFFLHDSDDYELIITCDPRHVEKIRSAVSSVGGVPVTEVGRITPQERGTTLLLPDGSSRSLSALGWDHFLRRGE